MTTRGVSQDNIVLMKRSNKVDGPKRLRIISHNFKQARKPRKNIVLQKLDDCLNLNMPCGNGFHPFGEVVSRSQDPFILTVEIWYDLYKKI